MNKKDPEDQDLLESYDRHEWQSISNLESESESESERIESTHRNHRGTGVSEHP